MTTYCVATFTEPRIESALMPGTLMLIRGREPVPYEPTMIGAPAVPSAVVIARPVVVGQTSPAWKRPSSPGCAPLIRLNAAVSVRFGPSVFDAFGLGSVPVHASLPAFDT